MHDQAERLYETVRHSTRVQCHQVMAASAGMPSSPDMIYSVLTIIRCVTARINNHRAGRNPAILTKRDSKTREIKMEKLQIIIDTLYENFPCSGNSETVISDLTEAGFTVEEITHALKGVN
jgi:hypothetical protein